MRRFETMRQLLVKWRKAQDGFWEFQQPSFNRVVAAAAVACLLLALWSRRDVCRKRPEVMRSSCCRLPTVSDDGPPRLTAVVYTKGPPTVAERWSRDLSRDRIDEVIICQDSPEREWVSDWATNFTELSHFVIRTNGLGVQSCYNRAMRSSSGSLFVLLQDGVELPDDELWLKNAAQLFDKLPFLGILGGSLGYMWEDGYEYEFGAMENPLHQRRQRPVTRNLPFVQPDLELPFMYVECVRSSPILVRSELLRYTRGFNVDKPENEADCLFAFDAWSAGMTVGLYGSMALNTVETIGKPLRGPNKWYSSDHNLHLEIARQLNHETLQRQVS